MALDSCSPLRTGPTATTIVDGLREWAGRCPARRAFTFLADGEKGGVDLTYGELDRAARALAGWLQVRDLQGSRVLLLYPPGLEFLSAFFGCLYAGVVAVPAYPPRPNRPMTRLQAIAQDSGATAVLTTSSLLSSLRVGLEQEAELANLDWVATDQVEQDDSGEWSETDLDDQALAFLQYTSGSTSTPKGVMVSHANLSHNAALIRHCFETHDKARGVFWLPLYHDMGLIGGVLQTLTCGGSATLMSPVAFMQRPLRWLQTITRTGATISGGPDFAYDFCVRKTTPEQRSELDLSSWELAFNGAEPVRAETLDRFAEAFGPFGFRRTAFYPCYGLAEATLLVSGGRKSDPPIVRGFSASSLQLNRVVESPADDRDRQSIVSCGRSLPDQRIVIADPETCVPCPAELVGEIWVSGPSVARGYWNRPEETERTFGASLAGTGDGPFLRTGDLGFLRDGELFVTGRLKDLIVIRGRNHYPRDIETTVENCCPSLRPAGGAAFSAELDGHERLIIVNELERGDRRGDRESIFRAMRGAISEHHELDVHAIVLLKVGTLPKTSSGKVQRRACRELFLADRLEMVARWTQGPTDVKAQPEQSSPAQSRAVEPPNAKAIQSWLVARLSAWLGVKPHELDVATPFVSFGMSSAQAVTLSGELEVWLGRRLSPTLIYNYPTIASLARRLADEAVASSLSARPQIPSAEENFQARALAEVRGLSEDEMNSLITLELAKLML